MPPPKKKSVHYSTMQNKQVEYTCLTHLRNRIMLNIDIPRYFCLDLVETKPVFELQKKKGAALASLSASINLARLPGRLKLTDAEKEHD